MPGRLPKPPAERRNRMPSAPQVQLPAEGRKGPVPNWPLSKATKAEKKVWDEIWATPQSVAWEKLGWFRTVARYVRLLVEAEKPGSQITLQGEVRQMEDRLGLSSMAMLRLRWEIVEDELAERKSPGLKVVDGF